MPSVLMTALLPPAGHIYDMHRQSVPVMTVMRMQNTDAGTSRHVADVFMSRWLKMRHLLFAETWYREMMQADAGDMQKSIKAVALTCTHLHRRRPSPTMNGT